jgi:ABC-type antimicrobial peptide transport system permease subunit
VAALGHEQVRTLYTLGGKVDESIIHERLLCAASLVFGSLALLLAFIGLYALLAYAVARRTREVGVRIALGASRTQVISMVVCDGLALTLFGIALGVPCAVGAGRVTGTLLFGVRPTDLVSLSLASVFLVLVAAAASFIPARRASGIDPMAALRCE